MRHPTNSFWEDMFTPHVKVQRNWLRRPILLFSTPILFISCALIGVFDGTIKLLKLCGQYVSDIWKGE